MPASCHSTFLHPKAAAFESPGGPWHQQDLASLLADAPDRSDLICGEGARWSTSQLRTATSRVAAWLEGHGVRHGDAVAWQLGNGPDVAALYLACWRLGAVAVPFHEQITVPEAQRVLEQLGEGAMVVAADDLPLASIATAVVGEGALLDVVGDATAGPPACRPHDLAVVLTTSGSSGTPKSVLLSHRALAYKARQIPTLHGTGVGDAVLIPAPMAHMAGLLHGVLHPIGGGAKAVIMRRWHAGRALDLIRDEGVTMLFGPPVYALGLAALDTFTAEAVASVRLVSSGGTSITESYVRNVERTFGAVVKRTYGSTEAPVVCTVTPGDDPRFGWTTDGRPVPGVELEIRAPDGTTRLPPGSQGELWLRGPEMCDGYLDPVQTAETFVDGWMRTRDLARIDEAGYVSILGRVSGLIIRGGMNISPAEVAAALEAHPDVHQAVVLGYPDEVYGERIAAFLVAERTLTRDDCVDWFRRHGVAKYKVPDRLVHVEAIPTLATYQKPDLAALRALL